MLIHWRVPAAVLAGLLWTSLWAMHLLTHGPGPDDERGRVFGLTHHDFGKLIVVPLVLVGMALLGMHVDRRRASGRLDSLGLALALAALAAMILGTALSLWSVPWGDYQVDWRDPRMMWGGIIGALGSVVLAVGLCLYAVASLRVRAWPAWVVLALAAGPLAIVPWLHMTPWGGLFGAAWLLIGLSLRSPRRQ